jgi:hypothetical protein
LSEQEKERLAELVAEGVPFWRICEVIGRDRWTTRRNINYLKRPPKPEPAVAAAVVGGRARGDLAGTGGR